MASEGTEETFSLSDIKERFETGDIEITCTRTIEADIAVWYSNDDAGVLKERGINVTLHLPLDDSNEHYYKYTFTLDNLFEVKKGLPKPIEVPLTFEDITHALGIHPDEKVWEIGNEDML
jgi:hypothetical protein